MSERTRISERTLTTGSPAKTSSSLSSDYKATIPTEYAKPKPFHVPPGFKGSNTTKPRRRDEALIGGLGFQEHQCIMYGYLPNKTIGIYEIEALLHLGTDPLDVY
jgi:hypothetical protein